MSARAKLASSPLYDTDFFAWTGEQARLLRAVAAEDALASLDIENIAEEIESLGRSDLHAVESLIGNILVQLIKIVSDPDALALAHWRSEVTQFQIKLRRIFSPSMRQRIDLDEEWEDAMQVAEVTLREWKVELPQAMPSRCPFVLDDLVGKDFRVHRAEAALAASIVC